MLKRGPSIPKEAIADENDELPAGGVCAPTPMRTSPPPSNGMESTSWSFAPVVTIMSWVRLPPSVTTVPFRFCGCLLRLRRCGFRALLAMDSEHNHNEQQHHSQQDRAEIQV